MIKLAKIKGSKVSLTDKEILKGAKNFTFTSTKPAYYEENTPYYNLRLGNMYLKGVTQNVAEELMKQYSYGVSKARSKQSMQKFVSEFQSNFFTNKQGRASLLMNNLSMAGGMNDIFIAGTKGKLSYQMQMKFDILSNMLAEISKNPSLTEQLYAKADAEFAIIGSKYERWKRNAKSINDREGSTFTQDDLRELEESLDRLLDIAGEFYEQTLPRPTARRKK